VGGVTVAADNRRQLAGGVVWAKEQGGYGQTFFHIECDLLLEKVVFGPFGFDLGVQRDLGRHAAQRRDHLWMKRCMPLIEFGTSRSLKAIAGAMVAPEVHEIVVDREIARHPRTALTLPSPSVPGEGMNATGV
jgi:hypothetical protein